MTNLLANIELSYNNNILKKTYNNYDDLISELYYNLGVIIKPSEELKNNISLNVNLFPLYDIYTENILLVSKYDLYSRITEFHFRPIDNNIIKLIKSKNNPDVSQLASNDSKGRLQAEKQLNFLSNFNLTILEDNFYKVTFNNSPIIGEISTCLRPSFLPILRSTTPYYTKTELIYLALNMKKWKDNSTIESVCSDVSEYDINAINLFKHQIYIKENYADKYIKYYSFFGSTPINSYLRFPDKNYRNYSLEKHIQNFRSILINSPSWDKTYYFYRWLSNDSFLKSLNIDDIWIDNGFLSVTRNPFLDPDKNYFGFILVKIKVPPGKEGSGLSIEFYSHFPEEQEILFPPSKFKLLNITDTEYYHPNPKVNKLIVSKYEFEWIEYIKDYIDITKYKEESIPKLLNFDIPLSGYNMGDNLDFFYNEYKNKFNILINDKYITFEINKLESGPYDKFFYINNLSEETRFLTFGKEFFLTWMDTETGNINLMIEIGPIIVINYYFKFSGMSMIENIDYNEILKLIKKLGHYFNIKKIILYSDYKKYSDIIGIDNFDFSKLLNYHDKQLYMSDCSYFNQFLHLHINSLSMKNNHCSKFTEFLYNNNELKYNEQFNSIKYLLGINLEEFILDLEKEKQLILTDTYVEHILKLAIKLSKNKISTSILSKNIKRSNNIIKSGNKFVDLYIYIVNNNNYLIPYLHDVVKFKYNVDLENIQIEINMDNINNYLVPFDILELHKNTNFVKRIYKTKKDYKFINI